MWMLLLGCLEKTTGESRPLDPRFTANAPGSGGSVVQHDPNAGPATPFSDWDGDTVVVSGEVHSDQDGPVDLDLLLPDPDAEGGVANVGKLLLEGPGAFELEVPVDLGPLHLQAFQDLGSPGPSDEDPYAAVTLTIRSDTPDAVALELVVGARSSTPMPRANSMVFAGHEGPWTTVFGVVTAPDGQAAVGVDLRRPDETSQTGDALLGREHLGPPGAYQLLVPRGHGPLTLQFSQDVAGNGPDPSDSFASVQVDVADQERIELDVTLVEGAFAGGGSPSPSGGGGGGGASFWTLGEDPVTLSGTITVPEGMEDAVVDLDIYRVDAQGHGGRSFLGKLKLAPGDFSVQAPRGYGDVLLEAAIDPDLDGPTAGDPKAECPCNPLRVGGEDVQGLELVLRAD